MWDSDVAEHAESSEGECELAFRHLVQTMPAAAYTCDAQGLITYFNQRAVELWGREPTLNDPVDRYCGSFKLYSIEGSPVPHDQCWMAKALADGKEYNEQEIVIERPDGSRWTALAHAKPYYNESGKVAGAVNVLVDITARKQAEQQLRLADRHKSEFLAMLAHELRNPLAPLRNGLQVMRLAGENRETSDEAIAMMDRQLGQVVRLIDDLLDLSRITNGKIELRKERVALSEIIHQAVETSRPLIESGGHHLTIIPSPPSVVVFADRDRLAQVFANLLNNSAKYSERGSRVWLNVEQQGSDVVVTIKDTGMGIPPERLANVFDMFSQGKHALDRTHGGLGIGLSLVRRLVEMHGGSVEAHSDGVGKGSEFTVRLSVVFPSNRRPQGSGNSREAPCSMKQRILVVDDNKDSAKSLAMLLKISGHDTHTAHDGLEAVEAAKKFRPDVVLLDIGLPKLNGYDACRSIRAQPWSDGMVLIALTGWGQDEDKARSKEAGFNFHLVKPVNPVDLEKLLDGLVSTSA